MHLPPANWPSASFFVSSLGSWCTCCNWSPWSWWSAAAWCGTLFAGWSTQRSCYPDNLREQALKKTQFSLKIPFLTIQKSSYLRSWTTSFSVCIAWECFPWLICLSAIRTSWWAEFRLVFSSIPCSYLVLQYQYHLY